MKVCFFAMEFKRSNIIDTYTKEEVIRMSMWALEAFGPSKLQVHIGIRDRAMVLLSTNIAFRGDSTRRLLWSDLFTLNLPMEMIGPEAELPVGCLYFSEQSEPLLTPKDL